MLVVTRDRSRPTVPAGTPPAYQSLMESCWTQDYAGRPQMHGARIATPQNETAAWNLPIPSTRILGYHDIRRYHGISPGFIKMFIRLKLFQCTSSAVGRMWRRSWTGSVRPGPPSIPIFMAMLAGLLCGSYARVSRIMQDKARTGVYECFLAQALNASEQDEQARFSRQRVFEHLR